MKNQKKLLVTAALPYANGPLHLGHMVEHIQTDIWVRAQRLSGRDCISVCGDDAHGTPIMIKAENLGISPETLIADIKASHEADFKDFHVHYDNYHTTHSSENQALATYIYEQLHNRGDILKKTVSQAFDPEKQMFLPDRYVKGECPSCRQADQYGDSCEHCGATYSPTDLKNPKSVLTGATPIQKSSEHYFFNLPAYKDRLQTWTQNDHLQTEVSNKLAEWFEAGLRTWDISRDAPYFGFEIPNAPGKYFYVWLDAPIGYMASFKQYCEKNPEVNFDDYWGANSTAELYHFVGKDIIYFHALFWPALLTGSGFRTPTAIFTHGFLTVNGAKMSKSRGTFITARDYLDTLDPDYCRYYFAAKLSNRIDDIDFNLEDFAQRVNADLVGKYVNIASRSAKFIHKLFDDTLADTLDDPALFQQFVNARESIQNHYLAREYHRAVREIMHLADLANQYVDNHKPWVLAKTPGEEDKVHRICTMALNCFYLLTLYLKPIVPNLCARAESFLNITPTLFTDGQSPLLGTKVEVFKPLLARISPEQLERLTHD